MRDLLLGAFRPLPSPIAPAPALAAARRLGERMGLRALTAPGDALELWAGPDVEPCPRVTPFACLE